MPDSGEDVFFMLEQWAKCDSPLQKKNLKSRKGWRLLISGGSADPVVNTTESYLARGCPCVSASCFFSTSPPMLHSLKKHVMFFSGNPWGLCERVCVWERENISAPVYLYLSFCVWREKYCGLGLWWACFPCQWVITFISSNHPAPLSVELN